MSSNPNLEKSLADYKRACEEIISKDNADSEAAAATLLHSLHGLENVDAFLLSKTHIGESVNKIRRKFAERADIHYQAVSLLKKWKQAVQNTRKRRRNEQIRSDTDSASLLQAVADDPIRIKSAKLLTNALKSTAKTEVDYANGTASENRKTDSLSELGEKIETAIFEDTGTNSGNRHYRARVRSRIMNLRDPRNADLVAGIIKGSISPKRVATMSPEAMAPEELRRLRQSFRKDSLRNYSMPDAGSTLHSSTFLCHKCGLRDCSYNVGQERLDGDYEPVAVTLVVCNRCGNRWKSY
ncbi:putative transcription elongation factor S-II [Trichuris suis]|nr:putative transcription elongation factor S-II [Trichuris suis]